MSAFLAVAAGANDLQTQILHANPAILNSDLDSCQHSRHTRCGPILTNASLFNQHTLNKQRVELKFSGLQNRQTTTMTMLGFLLLLLNSTAKPITACGLRLEDNALRIAKGINLGINVCKPHTCFRGVLVDARKAHALSCTPTHQIIPFITII